MKIRYDALERIADGLEKKYKVEPYIRASGVIVHDLRRIVNALKLAFQDTTETLSNGTILNEVNRIAETLESSFMIDRVIQSDKTADDALNRIAYVLEVGYGTGRTVQTALTRIAIALERQYKCEPQIDTFGCVKDGLNRIADVMSTNSFLYGYPFPVDIIVRVNGSLNAGDILDYDLINIDTRIRFSNGLTLPIDYTELDWNPNNRYMIPLANEQIITASYEAEVPED